MALVSPKLGLRIWNLITDTYDHDQLADNWFKLDQHDHTPGRGVQIPTEGIADEAITNDKLATDLAVNYDKMAKGSSGLAATSFSVYRNSNQSISSGSPVKVQFDTEEFDLSNAFDSVTNYRYVVPTNGYYRFSWRVAMLSLSDTNTFITSLYKNGTGFKLGDKINASATIANLSSSGSVIVSANASEYFEIFALYNTGSQSVTGGSLETFFQGELIGLKA